MYTLLAASYTLGAISGICNFSVVIYMLTFMRNKTVPSKSVLYLHLTQGVNILTSLPNTFNSNPSLCAFIGFLHYYSSFSNANINSSMIFILYKILFGNEDVEVAYNSGN